jgi:cytochrome P450
MRIVTRFSDVSAVLQDDDRFRVPFGPEWTAMGAGRNSVLGLDGPAHRSQREVFDEIMAE